MIPWKFRHDISNGSRVIVLTDIQQTDRRTDKHTNTQTDTENNTTLAARVVAANDIRFQQINLFRQARREAGARETISLSRDPITTSFCMRRDETTKASRERKHGEGCPLTIRLWVCGSVGSFPSGVRRPKMDFMHM